MSLQSFSSNTDNLIYYFIDPPFESTLFVLKILFIAIFFYFLLSIINYMFFKTHYFKWLYGETMIEILTKKPYGIRKLDLTWKKIEEKMKSGVQSDYKLALIEADGLLDQILKSIGYEGDNLDERLTKINPTNLSTLEEIKNVHKIRNDIIRDPNYQLTPEKAEEILSVYRKTFEELEFF